MRGATELRAVRGATRLRTSEEDRHAVFWTEALADPPAVYGERLAVRDGVTFRRIDPARSKLGAALARGYAGRLPEEGERWLYLGAASGTTASHVADLVGRSGAVFAVEKSLRPFARLLDLAERFPNLVPLLADARDPRSYLGAVPPVDGIYADVPQPDQVEIAITNGRWFLRRSGALLLALKTYSMGRVASPRDHLRTATAELSDVGEPGSAVALEPFHKGHFFFETLATRRWFDDVARAPSSRPSSRVGRRP
ncbi:MAG: fibrillarin-like rRNA/tRNA 2'-O-methyltransferase [Thermoplasmata archaeon]|nr:fibrillarin-like rRNA/tRNA 2'-O-methyltransferase [Thermoplasmata archaeon]